jgi:hypothetical protein
MDLGQYQNSIPKLPNLSPYRYERIFKMYQTGQSQYFYNILQAIYFPDDIDNTKVAFYPVQVNSPWTTISYNIYGSIELWWLIMLVNKSYNPIQNPLAGTVVKYIRPEYLNEILQELNNSLN